MSVKIKPITLWRTEVENKPGILARTLEPLASTHADLEGLGLAASATPTLLVTGDNKPGLGHVIAKAIGHAGVNVGFLVAQVVGRRYSAVSLSIPG